MKDIRDTPQSTRDVILHAIKATNEATVNELAEAASVSPVTVRHHLNGLLAEGLLGTRSVRRKVGRPYYIYSLSEKGQELFPQKYLRLSSRLMDELKNHFPPGTVAQLFEGVVKGLVAERRAEFEHLGFEDRLNYLVTMLEEEGFLARWEKHDDGSYSLIEYSCPYMGVGARHHEVCRFDSALITSILETKVTQHSCMLDGGDCCQYTISKEAVPVAA